MFLSLNRNSEAIKLSKEIIEKSKNGINLFHLTQILRIYSQNDLANEARNKVLDIVSFDFFYREKKLLINFDI